VKLSIIIPCYNEKHNLKEIVEAVKASNIPDKEIILVDDASTDGTFEFINNEIRPMVDQVIFHSVNMGKGAAIKSALPHISGDLVIIQDADLEYNPSEYPKLIAPIINDEADVVYGSRFLGRDTNSKGDFQFYRGNRFLTWLSNIVNGLKLTDMETCYKVLRSDVIRKFEIRERRFGVEPEITTKLARMKVRFSEVAISYKARTHAEGKKINWIDGLRAVYCIFRYRFF
jgi:glycosyltransferase involved in cell wall biosynthesis